MSSCTFKMDKTICSFRIGDMLPMKLWNTRVESWGIVCWIFIFEFSENECKKAKINIDFQSEENWQQNSIRLTSILQLIINIECIVKMVNRLIAINI